MPVPFGPGGTGAPGYGAIVAMDDEALLRADLQHQALVDSLAQRRQAQDEKYSNAEIDTMRANQATKAREDFLKHLQDTYVPGDIWSAEDKQEAAKLGLSHLEDTSMAKTSLGAGTLGNVVQAMPSSPTAPVTAAPIKAYRGTPEQVAMRQMAPSMPQGPMRSAMESGAPESVVRIAATDEQRREAVVERETQAWQNHLDRMAIAEQNSKDREAATAATAEARRLAQASIDAYRQGQLSEQQFRQQMAKATFDLKRQIFETTKANDLNATQRAAYNKILAEKLKAATPGWMGTILGGSSSIPDDQMDTILQSAYEEAKGATAGAGAASAPAKGSSGAAPAPTPNPMVDFWKQD